jgi:Zn-dependent peptidase ImmA (M78 family)/DNA-binding XRE family transcriptional regulator
MSIGERIKSARTRANLSQRDLGEAAEVSAMAISKYEHDQDVPGSAILIRLAKALGVKVEYFFRQTTVTLSTPVDRRRKSMSSLQEDHILGQVQDMLERYFDIENLLDMQASVRLPAQQHIDKLDDIEDIALKIRDLWHIGLAPIEELTEMCEDQGIKIGLVEGDGSFDALTLMANEHIPVIVLRRDVPGDRQRFSLAHELGHLVLEASENVNAEKAANRFAGALLAPQAAVQLELGSQRHTISTYELHQLKHKYGLSMQAWIYRAKDAGILAKQDATRLFKLFRQKNWHCEEPGDALPPEKPQRFERLVIHALCEGIISQARASELLGVPLSQFIGGEVERHGGLPIEICG